ncbi:hypothetical protein AVEN_231289-1 [Araneus ventricosus]|uniref:Transcription factor IIIC putative zinc-finger domain-containing protein n=1 Tax=Araneus ventricosus TaxID=182803 RepID=A0A4Y2CHB3_ARAVE|nr:hypothetical protein AVEN_231289-1 [Araneus ventricosus]
MCGSLKGILGFLPVAVVMADEELTISVKNLCKVWDEEDCMSVDHIAVLKIALRKYICIAAKVHALVGCEILLTEDSIMIRNVGHSFGLHKLPVTGMAVIDMKSIPQYKVLIATTEGKLIEVKVSLGEDEIKFQHDRLTIDLDLKNNMIQGLALSTNGLLGGIVLKTSVYYDHLEKKEPLQFAMFVTKPFEEIYAKLKNVLKPQYSFLNTDSNAITSYTDYLDIIRMNLAAGIPLPDWLTAFTTNAVQNYENSYSTLELYFMRFILHAYVSGLAVGAPKDKANFEAKMREIDALIMRRYISKVINSCKESLDLLSPGQAQSLLLMADWLFKKFDTTLDFLYAAFGCDIPSENETLPARETCGICKQEVKLEDLKVAQCLKGHTFTRCCQSLLLCDVSHFSHCPACKSVVLKDIWNFDPYCTYCGMMTI